MKKNESSKTVRQWGVLGRVPKENAEPSYIWTDFNENPCTYYYLEQDTREMTEAEKVAFEEADRKKHPSQYGAETNDHKRMRLAYENNEIAYKAWAEHWKLFNQRGRDRYYYRKGVNRERRKALAEWVLRDFPKASFRDVASQIGGCREIIWEFGLWETSDDVYWTESRELYFIYQYLRHCPEDIRLAIDDPAQFAKRAMPGVVKAADVRRYIPRILRDIGLGFLGGAKKAEEE